MVGPLERQPDKLDYVSPTQFKFGIHQLPKVEFFVQSCNLPGISMSTANLETSYKDIPIMGDKVTYDPLTITFLVDEYLENYISLHNWITGIGFPESRTQFSTFRDTTSNTPPTTPASSQQNDIGVQGKPQRDRAMYSDANLIVLTNKNNPVIEIDFKNVFPTTIGSLEFNQGATDVEYMTCTGTFQYQIYEINTI